MVIPHLVIRLVTLYVTRTHVTDTMRRRLIEKTNKEIIYDKALCCDKDTKRKTAKFLISSKKNNWKSNQLAEKNSSYAVLPSTRHSSAKKVKEIPNTYFFHSKLLTRKIQQKKNKQKEQNEKKEKEKN